MRAVILALLVLTSGAAVSDDAPPDRHAIPTEERSALLQLFASTDGDHWTRRDGWGGAVGSECDWYGVSCDYSDPNGARVTGLFLSTNNLRGSLPNSLSRLTALRDLLLAGNKLTGDVPSAVLRRFDDGEMRFHGYAGQFSPIVAIELTLTPSAGICGDHHVQLRVGGPVTAARKICRNSTPDDRATYWERSSHEGDDYSGDIDRLARLVEKSGFSGLASSYWRGITHGATETITVTYRDGRRKSVEDYAESAPAPMWLLKRAIAGAAFSRTWEKTTTTRPIKQ